MSQRLLNNTKWLWCLLVLHAGSFWDQTSSVAVRSGPNSPTTVAAQAKFFQDFFSVQLSPYKIEFGHVCEDPNTWEQRYEKKDFENHRDMGKVRWGDKKGGYGEHYWDLNHVGHVGSHDDDGDDGSYSPSKYEDPYDEPSDNTPTYGNEEYNPERSSYEESGRAKRAHPKIKVERKQKHSETYEEQPRTQKQKRKNKEELETAATHEDEEYAEDDEEDEEEVYEKPKRRQHYRKQEDSQHHYIKQKKNQQKQSDEDENQYQSKQKQVQEETQQPKEKNQIVLVVSEKDDSEKPKQQFQPYGVKLPQYVQNQPQLNQYVSNKQQELNQYVSNKQPELNQYVSNKQAELNQYVSNKQPDLNQYAQRQPDPSRFVPYEGGAGVREHHQPEVSAATTVPRLFLEPSTGHVVDRATGQAYVLQPIAPPKYQ